MNFLIKKYISKKKFLFNKSFFFFFNRGDNGININYFCYYQTVECFYDIIGYCFDKKYNENFFLSNFYILTIFKNIKINQIYFFGSPFLIFLKKLKTIKKNNMKKFFLL